MNQKALKKIKEKLKREKLQIEKELESFAKRDKKVEGDWDARFPKWNGGGSSSNMEIAADEVEEYSKLLSLEYVLEIRLKNINLALEKIKKKKYGVCEKCGKKIPNNRLEVYPEARYCLKCK
ncbi:MAG: TraR/DksA family transcriptional regulator [Candidatus Nealsonbacteria bacterium]|nr:MAG: TraR/DksA family transcriptional regulator [Candidatus Nealsonbacteria bacterium]